MMKKILLLDIENIHKNEKEILQLLQCYTNVYLVYAKSPVSLSLDALVSLSPSIENKKLVLIKMPKIGIDAADFGLAFLAGQLSIQLPKKEIEFVIMSNDKKLEYIVDLLKIMGFKASQLKEHIKKDKETEKKRVTSPIIQTDTIIPDQLQFNQRPHLLQLKKFCEVILNCTRPNKVESLKNTIRSKLNISVKEENKIFSLLINYKIVAKMDNDKVIFNENNLRKWAEYQLSENFLTFDDVQQNSINEKKSEEIITDKNEDENIYEYLLKNMMIRPNLMPKYLLGFTMLLEKNYLPEQVPDLITLCLEKGWITFDGRKVLYNLKSI